MQEELAFKFNDEFFENKIYSLDAARREYKTGDQQLVADILE